MKQIRLVSVALLAMGALLIWRATYKSGCAPVSIPLIVIGVVGWHSAEYFIFRRKCLASCLFIPGSFFHRMYNRTSVTIGFSMVMSIVSGLALALSVLTWSLEMLIVLAIDGIILALVAPVIIETSGAHLQPAVKRIAMKNVMVLGNTILLLFVLLPVQYYSRFPEFINVDSLLTTLSNARQAMESQCTTTDIFTKFQGAKEGFGWWLMLKESAQLPDANFRTGAWLIFLISGTLSVSAYSKLIVQLANIADSSGETDGQG